jgi:hypothetical protein
MNSTPVLTKPVLQKVNFPNSIINETSIFIS